MTHPIIQRQIDLAASAEAIADDLEAIALAMPVNCPLPKDYGCACTGACHPKEFYDVLEAAGRLRVAVKGVKMSVPKLP